MMLFRVTKKNNKNKSVHGRTLSSLTAIFAGVAVFAIVSFAPVTFDFSETALDLVAPAAALAKSDRGGGRDGSKGGGRGGGKGGTSGNNGGGNQDNQSGGNNGGGKDGTSGNNGGGNNGGGNNGGGNNGGGNNGGGNNGGGNNGGMGNNASSPRDGGRESRPRQPTTPSVALAVFTTAIKKRYPANNVEMLDDPHQAVSFFNELHAMAGKRITHRWVHNGSVMFEANFDVMAQRWRIWSTQVLPADLAGEWIVEVVDQDGNILETGSLSYQPKDAGQLALR
jgi:hypothetical protein